MSTQVNLYIMYCAPIPIPKEADYERYDKAKLFDSAYDGIPKKLFVLYDGMCGKYAYAGYALAKSEDLIGEGYGLHGVKDHAITMDKMPSPFALALDIKKELGITVDQKQIKTRVIMHYR